MNSRLTYRPIAQEGPALLLLAALRWLQALLAAAWIAYTVGAQSGYRIGLLAPAQEGALFSADR